MRSIAVSMLAASACLTGIASAGEFLPALGEPVPNQFIVVLDHAPGERLENVGREVSELLLRERVSVTGVWNSAVHGFVASEISESAARKLSTLPGVAFIEPDVWGRADSVQNNAPYGLDLIDQRTLQPNGTYVYNYTGSNIHAYVLDSGIRTTHADFGGRATNDVDFTNEAQGGDLLSGEGGHGTGVASVIGGATYGVAKQIRLHSVRVISLDASTFASRIVSGLNWVNQNGIRPGVVNMSLQLTGPSTAVDSAIVTLVNGGMFVSVAAGNKLGWSVTWPDSLTNACQFSPAREPKAFTVAAPAGYSYRGSCVDIFAPSGVPVASSSSDNAVKTGIGTSFSAPHASGAAALVIQQFPALASDKIGWELIARATKNAVDDFFDGFSFVSLYSAPNRWLYSLPLPYTTVPTTPGVLTMERCNTSTIIDWTAGSSNNTNTPTYYELWKSTDVSFSTSVSTYYGVYYDNGGGVLVGQSTSPALPTIYAKARSCNSLGCSPFGQSISVGCGGGS